MLPVHWETIRLFLHILAATIWVGGQLTLAGLLPALRAIGRDTPRIVARRFNQLAWPAFGVLVATGIWNLSAEWDEVEGSYRTTLIVKLVVVFVSGITAGLHIRARARVWLAVYGALTGLSALTALFLGVLIGQ